MSGTTRGAPPLGVAVAMRRTGTGTTTSPRSTGALRAPRGTAALVCCAAAFAAAPARAQQAKAPDLKTLVEQLADADYRRRYEARDALEERDDPACLPLLMALAERPASQPAAYAATGDYEITAVLERLTAPAASDALRRLVPHPRRYFGLYAARSLAARGDRGGLKHHLDQLAKPGADDARGATTLNFLRYSLKADEAPQVRTLLGAGRGPLTTTALCEIAAQLGDAQAKKPLEGLLAHERDTVQVAALLALIALGERARTADLIERLKRPGISDAAVLAALAGIERQGLRELLPALRALLGQTENLAVKRAVLSALLTLKDYASAPAFARELASTDETLAALAFRGVVELGGDEAARLVAPALDDANPKTRIRAAEALGRMNDLRGMPVLRALLGHEDAALVRDAVTALGTVRDGATARDLLPLLDHADVSVRRAAASALTNVVNSNTLYHPLDLAAEGYDAEADPAARRAVLDRLRARFP